MPGRIEQFGTANRNHSKGLRNVSPSYVDRLNSDFRYAMNEGDAYFQEKGAVHETLRRIAKRLDELGIKYAVAGGLALFSHGFRRFTEDVDLLVTAEGLKEVHGQLEGLGYIAPFAGSKNLRDTVSGVKIDFLISGQFPGDGKPKPIAFPSPGNVFVERQGIRYLNLESIVELKLASGMSNSERMKDIVDVQELIKVLTLPCNFASKLSPFVQEKYAEVWDVVRPRGKKYIKLWSRKFLTAAENDIKQMDQAEREAVRMLETMRADGVYLGPEHGSSGEFARLITEDPAIAKKYDMHEESEFLEGPGDKGASEAKPK